MPNNPLLITGFLASRQDFYRALARCLLPRNRPAPTNLDGMADLLREARIDAIICTQWALPSTDSRAVRAVLRDLSITLQRSPAPRGKEPHPKP